MAEWAALGLAGANMGMGLAQANAKQKAEAAALSADAQARTEALNREQADTAADREKKLRHAMAASRAGMAGAGISQDGSAAAILAGMNQDNADQAARETARYDAARSNAATTYTNRYRMSLLDRNASQWNSLFNFGRATTNFFGARTIDPKQG